MESCATDVENEAIAKLGLRRVATDDLAITRQRKGKRFAYVDEAGKPTTAAQRRRIAALAIPPAWQDVRISRDANAHLQAVGRDEAGRLQYIYHADWDEVRAATKTHRLLQLGKALAKIRAAIARDLDDEAKAAIAAAAWLIDRLHLRAGHEGYAGDEGGRGAASLLKRHVAIDAESFRLRFRGKGGKLIDKTCSDAKFVRVLESLMQLRGARLFKIKGHGAPRAVTATAVNKYLSSISGRPVTAKDFRTLHASALALQRLRAHGEPASDAKCRKAIVAVAREVAEALANTPAVVRKSYIHPLILETFEARRLERGGGTHRRMGLSLSESRLMRFLETAAE